MAKEPTTATLDPAPDAAASGTDFQVSDVPLVDGEQAATPTPTPSDQLSSEEIANLPDFKAAWDRAFGDTSADAQDATPDRRAGRTARTTRTDRQRAVDTADELDGLDGATEGDDDVEPDGVDERPAADHAVSEPVAAKAAPDDQPQGDDEEGAEQAPTLNPTLLLAAKRAGWNEVEISDFVKASPDLAEKTFRKLLNSLNDVSAEYGRLGSQTAVFDPYTPPQVPPAPRVGPQAPATAPTPPGYPPQQPGMYPQRQAGNGGDDVMAAIYGEQFETFDQTYGPGFMNAVIQPLVDHLVGPIQNLQEKARVSEINATGREIGGFFKGLTPEFAGLYGEGTDVGESQLENRTKLGQMADQIRAGALRQGIDLSVGDCLERANLMFSAEHLSELERKKITASVQKRSRQISQRPSQRRRATPPAGEKSIEAAERAYTDRAIELGVKTTE